MLYERGVAIEAKPFSIGFRIEHPQGLVDKARFGRSIPELGAAEYRLVHHASEWPQRLQFLHVSRRHGGGGHQRGGPRGHQWHEPIFPQ